MHWTTAATLLNWIIALFWTWRTLVALKNLPKIPNLLHLQHESSQPKPLQPQITVIVPARNEAQAIEQTLRSLLAQTVPVEIIAIDDRSTDATGEIMDRLAAEASRAGKSLTVIHVTELPAGWMGKTHAMALAARQSTTPWLLFTDGDVLFSEDALQRALEYAEGASVDHLVIFPTLILKTFGERMMIALFQALSAIAAQPWKIADPQSRRESLGIGAFNMARAEAYRSIGGFEALRMEVLEDLRLGFEMKRNSFRQHVAFGPGLLRIHWAAGAFGILRNLTKNFFAVFRFKPQILMGACVFLTLLSLGPFAGWFGSTSMRLASALMFLMITLLYRYYRQFTGIGLGYVLTFPIAAALLVYAILRSMAVTLTRGGVDWRGTFYSLKELRQHAGPLR